MSLIYVGLDGEMSGTDLQHGSRLIQIGFALENGATYTSYINPGEMTWSEEAEGVHKISQDRIPEFPLALDVDQAVYTFLTIHGASQKKRGRTIPVGWNVGSFDMPFVKFSLPLSYTLFSRRVVDLNSLCFALDGLNNLNFDSWKKRSKEYAIEKIGYEDAHDAGWDARMSLYCFEFLKEKIVQGY